MTLDAVNHYIILFFDAHFRRIYRDGDQLKTAFEVSSRCRLHDRARLLRKYTFLTVHTVNHYITLFFDAHFRRVYWDGDQLEAVFKASCRRRFQDRARSLLRKYTILPVYTVNH